LRGVAVIAVPASRWPVVCCGDRPAVVRRHLGQWTADMAKPVRADLAPGLPGHGRGDAARLQQVQRPSTPSPLCGSISADICGWPSLTPALLPATSTGAQCWRPDGGFRIGEDDRTRRPQGDLGAAAGSGTINRRGRRHRQHPGCVPVSLANQRRLRRGTGARRCRKERGPDGCA